MAEVDEDEIPGSAIPPEEIDLSEETQDFRFLAALTGTHEAKIPKRGEKDFEEHGTALQADTLAASRQAMHNALSFERVHIPRKTTLATYHSESNMAYSYQPRGSLLAKMGRVLPASYDPLGDDERRHQRVWYLPEEVIYLLERGTIDVRWPLTEEDEDGQGLPMSLQAAYAMCIGHELPENALTLEQYCVYSSLNRAGYVVLRANSFNGPGPPPGLTCYPPMTGRRAWQIGMLNLRWLAAMFAPSTTSTSTSTKSGSLVAPGPYRNYTDIYRRLALISWHDPTNIQQPQVPTLPSTDPSFRVTYDVWKPGNPNFRKTNPGPPDFHIAVVNARETSIPSLDQLSRLMETVPYDPPRPEAQLYQKLKHGYKSVVLAIVDQGVISYLRLADAAFGREKLYERKGPGPGNKRGGRGKQGKRR